MSTQKYDIYIEPYSKHGKYYQTFKRKSGITTHLHQMVSKKAEVY